MRTADVPNHLGDVDLAVVAVSGAELGVLDECCVRHHTNVLYECGNLARDRATEDGHVCVRDAASGATRRRRRRIRIRSLRMRTGGN